MLLTATAHRPDRDGGWRRRARPLALLSMAEIAAPHHLYQIFLRTWQLTGTLFCYHQHRR